VRGGERVLLGKAGEDLACRELRRRGYTVLARRYRTRVGEIDIVARDGETVVFVEVKARTTSRFGAPQEAVTWRKRARLRALAADYLSRHNLTDSPCRFEVVAVTIGAGRRPHLEVVPAAFE
jgi:putative endonuclease